MEKNVCQEIDVIIEIPKGGYIKYEYDKEKNMLVCDRILHTPMKYPFNYGFVPNTLSEDGDPLDVVVLTEEELLPGCLIRCKILGYLDTKDDAGNDPKMIACPIDKIDPLCKNLNDLSDGDLNNLSKPSALVTQLIRIRYFFEHYKDLENKKVIVGGLYNKTDAINIYKRSLERCQKKQIVAKITDYYKPIIKTNGDPSAPKNHTQSPLDPTRL